MTHASKTQARGRLNLAITIAAAIAIGLLINILVAGVRVRADLTENDLNVLSDASRQAVRDLEGLEVRVYISPDLPDTVPAGGGRDLRLTNLPRLLSDKLSEYAAYGSGMSITRVTEDLVGEAERNRIRTFAGRGAEMSTSGSIEFKRYVLGASFHYKNQVEVLETALQPEYLEFEITRRLVRLKAKAEFAVTMKDMLDAARGVGDTVRSCVEALEKAKGDDSGTADPLALLSPEGNDKTVTAMKGAAPAIRTACSPIGDAVTKARTVKTNLEAYTRVNFIAEVLQKETTAFVDALSGAEVPPAPQLVATHQRLVQIGKAIDNEVRAVEDSPGQRRIGFVCNARAFCPFPDPEPLYNAELARMMGGQDQQQMMQQQLMFLDRLQEQIGMILQQINQGLFRGRGFDIVRVDLDKDLPDDLAALVVYGPTGDFSDWQLHQLDQFVLHGGSLVAFISPWDVGLQLWGKGGEIEKPRMIKQNSNFHAFLAHHGLRVNGALVLEPEAHGDLSLMQFLRQGERLVPFQSVPVPYPMLPTFSDMDTSDPLVRATPTLTLPFTTWFELEQRQGLETTALVRASRRAASVDDAAFPLDPQQQIETVLRNPANRDMAVVALARGEFTSYFNGKTRPEKPKTDADKESDKNATEPPSPRATLEKGSGRVLAIGSNLGLTSLGKDVIFEGFKTEDVMPQGGGALFMKLEDFRTRFENWSTRLDQVQATLQNNLQFLQNVMDWSVQQDAIAELRSKQYAERPLDITDSTDHTVYRALGIALSPALLLVFGAFWTLRRRARRRSLAA
jgi:hypothetical protein